MTLFQSPSLRVALGLGDQELEQRVRPSLETNDELQIVAHCLSADQVLEVAQVRQVDAVVLAWSLHRLTDAVLRELERPGLIVVLLVPRPEDERWRQRSGPVLAVDADASTIVRALVSARPGIRAPGRPKPATEPTPLKRADRPPEPAGDVIAVTGGGGSPGRTTVAINLAAALGVGGSTALVEADFCSPSIAAYLDRDPTRNVCTLSHAVRDDSRVWSAVIADELQPLGPSNVSAVVLCGPPKREMRSTVAPNLTERLIDELARRFRWVVLDVGPEVLGMDVAAANHRAALARAQHVFMVSGADLVSLWHTRAALDQLERSLGFERGRVNLVLNRHDARFHHARQEVEWHLGAPVVAVVPFDHAPIQRAVSNQRPVVLDASSRAARALLALAEGLSDGKLRFPAEPSSRAARPAWWRRLLGRQPVARASVRKFEADLPPITAMQEQRSRAW